MADRAESPESPAQLAAQLPEQQKKSLAALVTKAQAFARESISTAKKQTNAKEQGETLTTITAQATVRAEQILDSIASTPAGAETMRKIECRKGCSFCCHLTVGVTIIEAISIATAICSRADYQHHIPPVAAAPLRGPSPKTPQQRPLACVFLRDNACSIYEIRPSACRAVMSFSAEACEDDFASKAATGEPVLIPSFASPKLIATAINAGVSAACADEGLQSCAVELTAGLKLLFEDDHAVSRWLRGEQVFTPYSET